MQERTAGEAANRLRLSLVSVTQQAVDIVAVELAKAHHSPLATAVARTDRNLRAGMPRQTSLCNPPSEHQYVLAVLKGPKCRDGSLAMRGDERAPATREIIHHDSMLRAGLPRARAALVSDG